MADSKGPTKEELKAEIDTLSAQLRPAALEAKKDAERRGVGKAFNVFEWLSGREDRKYAAGPAFMPYPFPVSGFNLLTGISMKGWAYTLLFAAVSYGVGWKYHNRVGIRGLRGHNFGLILAVPSVTVGVVTGMQAAYYRHVGIYENGMPCLYEGYNYTEAPAYLRHIQVGRDTSKIITNKLA